MKQNELRLKGSAIAHQENIKMTFILHSLQRGACHLAVMATPAACQVGQSARYAMALNIALQVAKINAGPLIASIGRSSIC